MTVAELIHALSLMPDQDATVWAQGCDCTNPVEDIEEYPDRGEIVLTVNLD